MWRSLVAFLFCDSEIALIDFLITRRECQSSFRVLWSLELMVHLLLRCHYLLMRAACNSYCFSSLTLHERTMTVVSGTCLWSERSSSCNHVSLAGLLTSLGASGPAFSLGYVLLSLCWLSHAFAVLLAF